MKRIIYFIFVMGCLFLVGSVNADTYKEDSGWSASSDGACSSFTDELKASYEGYSFNKSTGKFSTTGKTYAEIMSSASTLNTLVYFSVSSDGRTLYAYIPSWENNASLVSDYNFPAYQCSEVYKVEKVSIKTSDSSSDSSDDEEIIDDSDSSYDSSTKSNTNGNSYTEEETSSNPTTGISSFWALPLVLGGGVVLVLGKRRLLG